MQPQIGLIILLILPFAGSLLLALLRNKNRNMVAWLSGAVTLAALVLAIILYPAVTDGGVTHYRLAWLPELGLDFVIRMDGLAWLFTVLITGIGGLVVLYARYYLSPTDSAPRFFSFLLAFMGAMLGIVLSGNLIQLAFFWELTSLFSFLLIGYWHHDKLARDGARMSLIVTAGGGLSLLVGFLLIGHIVGSYELDTVLASGDLIRSSPLYPAALVLVLLGALTKSAQFPFHFWLPRAMAAPTPVSAYLHSATLVKAGVFLLVRFWPVLGMTDYWLWLVGLTGLVTFVFGAVCATFQQDLKRLLAYSTISHLGLITLLIGLDSPLALVAAIFHIINHATFKSSLFMAAGVVDHECGTRDIRRLGGLRKLMPVTATLATVAAAAMAGVPLLNGFLSKEMFFAETIQVHGGSIVDDLLPYVVTVASMFTVAYSVHFIRGTFFGRPATDLPRVPQEPPRWMRFPIEFLVLICLVVGIIPALTVAPFLQTAVSGVLGMVAPQYSLVVWHGFTLPLMMSVIALAGGATAYLLLKRHLENGMEGIPGFRRIEAQRIFNRLLDAISLRWSVWLERLFGTRRLQPQLQVLLFLALVAGAWPLFQFGLAPGSVAPSNVNPAFALMWAVGIACAIGSAWMAKFHRLAALILMGGAGLVTCITFVWLSAPDLALTQLLVEIVTTVLLVLGLRWLPKRIEGMGTRVKRGRARARRLRDLLIAVAAGAGLSVLAYAVMTRPLPESISRFFAERAFTGGGGTNIVNVILVDFRGFDTLGEITVLCVVALTVFALLRRFRPASESIGPTWQQHLQHSGDDDDETQDAESPVADHAGVPAVILQLLFPFTVMLALFFLLRGHNLPGGGFVAGITMAVAFILQYMAMGIRQTETRLRIHPLRWMATGLLLAVSAGVGSWLFSQPFLTSHHGHAVLPWIGEVPLASALIFDLGVFGLVVGATALILIALAHQSIRSHPTPPTSDAPHGAEEK